MPGWDRHDAALAHPGAGGAAAPWEHPPAPGWGQQCPSTSPHLHPSPWHLWLHFGLIFLILRAPISHGACAYHSAGGRRDPFSFPSQRGTWLLFFLSSPHSAGKGSPRPPAAPPELTSPSPKPQFICFARAPDLGKSLAKEKRRGERQQRAGLRVALTEESIKLKNNKKKKKNSSPAHYLRQRGRFVWMGQVEPGFSALTHHCPAPRTKEPVLVPQPCAPNPSTAAAETKILLAALLLLLFLKTGENRRQQKIRLKQLKVGEAAASGCCWAPTAPAALRWDRGCWGRPGVPNLLHEEGEPGVLGGFGDC